MFLNREIGFRHFRVFFTGFSQVYVKFLDQFQILRLPNLIGLPQKHRKTTEIFMESYFWAQQSTKKYIFWVLFTSNVQPAPNSHEDPLIWILCVKCQNPPKYQADPWLQLRTIGFLINYNSKIWNAFWNLCVVSHQWTSRHEFLSVSSVQHWKMKCYLSTIERTSAELLKFKNKKIRRGVTNGSSKS